MTRKNYYELKATLVGKKQEIKRLKKVLKQTKKEHTSVLEDQYDIELYLRKDLIATQEALEESRRKKWYQFEQI